MTDITALDELIKAVEAGDEWVSVKADAAFDDKGNAVMACRAYGADGHPERAGSIDAAKALHDALLPGWWYVIDHRMCSVSDMFDGPFFSQDTHDSPARAWLLAVLRAYRAQIGGAA